MPNHLARAGDALASADAALGRYFDAIESSGGATAQRAAIAQSCQHLHGALAHVVLALRDVQRESTEAPTGVQA